ncbi:ADP-ribosyl cyclase/cyclic ADP-ribose hydrolase 2-like [Hyla sarda]|uniref:ADP-ribosyl cyclase/cyclic ADP-ribose hydrolase 2-like n=1 Tax=Hyla sarda TaxID=327740 RepID=UPI0024C24ABB|nr:ADP-ribosyl cyclase/cyclic ADP-ribose hydrolase 2-like [Hyla sarda]
MWWTHGSQIEEIFFQRRSQLDDSKQRSGKQCIAFIGWPKLKMQLSNLTMQSLLFYIVVMIQLKGTCQWKGPGTTPNLETIVIGRCYDYIETVNPSVGKKNCSAIWEAFKSAFVSKDPCSVIPSDYERYVNLTLHDLPINKSLFWENNKQLVHRLSDRGHRYMALGDTLMGWLADNLDFCGSSSDSGFDYNSCPMTSECEHNPGESFWRLASITYAKHSHGEIQIMLNGSTPGGGFPVPSFLADFEIPNFQRDKVSSINIWVMDEIEGANVDSCGKNSTATLESVLSRKGFPYTCYDNYRPVRILQCVDFPGNPDCSTNSGIGLALSWVTMIPVWFVTIINYGH